MCAENSEYRLHVINSLVVFVAKDNDRNIITQAAIECGCVRMPPTIVKNSSGSVFKRNRPPTESIIPIFFLVQFLAVSHKRFLLYFWFQKRSIMQGPI